MSMLFMWLELNQQQKADWHTASRLKGPCIVLTVSWAPCGERCRCWARQPPRPLRRARPRWMRMSAAWQRWSGGSSVCVRRGLRGNPETETTRLLREDLTAILGTDTGRGARITATLTGKVTACGDRPWCPAPVKPENLSNGYRSKTIEVDDDYAMTTGEYSVFERIIS
jgi:hypothetical protein